MTEQGASTIRAVSRTDLAALSKASISSREIDSPETNTISTVTVLGAGGVVVVFMLYSGNTRAMAQAEANNSLRVVTRTTDSLPDPGKFDLTILEMACARDGVLCLVAFAGTVAMEAALSQSGQLSALFC